MNLESQVTSLELSKKLLTLGVKQESFFNWNDYYGKGIEIIGNKIFDEGCEEYYSAFTASELLELIPKNIEYLYLKIYKGSYEEDDNLYVCELNHEVGHESDYTYFKCTDETLCDALAKMLIHLIENELIEI